MSIISLYIYLSKLCIVHHYFCVILKMLTIKELQALIELLNKKEQTLERVEQIFLSKFKDAQSVFRASYAISNLLSFNLLTSLQRIPAIFLLIENYKHEGISSHPFGATIFQTVHQTVEPFERVMISDIIIDERRQEYSRFSVQFLYEKAQKVISPIEQRPEIAKLEDQFLKNLPEMTIKAQSQVKNVVRDFLDKDKGAQIPEYHVNLSGIKESQIGYEAFNIGFMRPIPKFIDIEPSQFHWFSPGANLEVEWDRTAEAEMKLAKAKSYLKKAVNQHLTKDESTEIEQALDSSPNAVLHLEVSPEMILPMIKQTPFLVFAYLAKLSNFPIFDTYLEVFLEGEISLNMIDVVSKIIKGARVPTSFILAFTNSIMQKVISDKGNERDKMARYVISFIKNLNKMKIINMLEIQEKLTLFMQEFKTLQEVNQLQQIKNSLSKQ